MSEEIIHVGALSGKSIRFIRSPLGGARMPWVVLADLVRALRKPGLPMWLTWEAPGQGVVSGPMKLASIDSKIETVISHSMALTIIEKLEVCRLMGALKDDEARVVNSGGDLSGTSSDYIDQSLAAFWATTQGMSRKAASAAFGRAIRSERSVPS